MAVYKQGSLYRYDFQLDGCRFFGATKARSKKEARAVEDEARRKARADTDRAKATGKGPLTFDIAAGQYWSEVGQHHVNSATTFTDLARLAAYFGKEKRLDEITDAEVATMVAWRRKQTIKGRAKDKSGKAIATISAATVNRSTTILLKAMFTRAKRTWRYQFPNEPNWRDHFLKEPKERVRFLDQPEATALDAAVRDDYALWFSFARLTGLRRNETLLRWSNVNWSASRITTTGKGGKEVSTPITPLVRSILHECKGQHPEFVFTYVCQRPAEGQVKGRRYPITAEGAKTQWRRLRTRANVSNFRFHDIRHDVATRLLRHSGNLKLVQKALNHSDIKTTVKYAHVLDEEVAAALETIGTPTISPTTDLKRTG